MESTHIPLDSEETAWGCEYRFSSLFSLSLTLWSDNTTLLRIKKRKRKKGRTNSNLRNIFTTVFHCDSSSIQWIHDSTIVEVVDFVFMTRTIVVIYFLDVAVLHLRRFIRLRGLVGNNNWIHQGVSIGHIYLGDTITGALTSIKRIYYYALCNHDTLVQFTAGCPSGM